MSLLAMLGPITTPELTVGLLGIALMVAFGIYALFRRFPTTPASPDPWDDQIANDLAEGNATPLCHHCLMPHKDSTDFCPHCGAAVGTYTNLLPFPYLFSIGHVLRIGTCESFKRSPVTVGGFFLLGIAEYSIFAPVYWVKFLRNSRRSTSTPSDAASSVPENQPDTKGDPNQPPVSKPG